MDSETSQTPRPRRRAVDWPTAVLIAIVVTAASYVYWRDGAQQFMRVAWSDIDLFGGMLPKVLAGCLIAAFATILLPRDKVGQWVGADSGVKGILIATFAGIILPGGPFTIFPLAGAFIAVGADVAAAITLITSWSLLGINRALVWELPFFGYDFVGWRMLAALPLPIVAGFLARLLGKFLASRSSGATKP